MKKNQFLKESKKFAVLLLLISSIAFGIGTNLSPKDFAYTLKINADNDHLLYTLPIPAAVYQHAFYKNLTDLRIFNAENRTIPFKIENSKLNLIKKQDDVSFYPISISRLKSPSDLSLNISQQKSGLSVKLHSTEKFHHQLPTYLLDMSKFKIRGYSSLTLNWHANDNQTQNNWILSVKIQGSDDLKNWDDISNGSIASLRNKNGVVIQNTITLPKTYYRYLLLNLNKTQNYPSCKNLTITKIFINSFDHVLPKYQSIEVFPTFSQKAANTYFFDIQGHYPIRGIKFKFPEKNTSASITLFSRNSVNQSWQFVKSAILYHLRDKNTTIDQSQVSFDENRDRYWKIETELTFLKNNTKVYFQWIPDQLIFSPQGNKPFHLTFGNSNIINFDTNASDFIKQIINKYPGSVQFGQASIAGKLHIQPNFKSLMTKKIPYHFTQVYLWIILIIAAITLSIMAFYLYKQLKK